MRLKEIFQKGLVKSFHFCLNILAVAIVLVNVNLGNLYNEKPQKSNLFVYVVGHSVATDTTNKESQSIPIGNQEDEDEDEDEDNELELSLFIPCQRFFFVISYAHIQDQLVRDAHGELVSPPPRA